MTETSIPNLVPVRAVDPPLRGEVGIGRFFLMHILALVLPLTAGIILYGWRAALAIGLVVGSALAGMAIWGRIGRRGRRINFAHGLWLAMLLAMMLPAHLATGSYPRSPASHVWAVLVGAGLALAILLWLFGGIGSGRVHTVLAIYLLLVILFQNLLVPHFVLLRERIGVGDLLGISAPVRLAGHRTAPPTAEVRKQPWTSFRPAEPAAGDALYTEPASARLVSFTTGTEAPDRAALSLEELIRDKMPPLEDLIVGGQPAPIGLGSAIAVIMGGLYLLYRGLIDFRVPLIICVAAYLAFLLLPIPVTITEHARTWRSLIIPHPGGGLTGAFGRGAGAVGWATAITFVNYELMAGPLLFVAFFLATSPGVRPLSRRGRTIYAVCIGVAAAALQLYLDVSYGAYLAILVVSLITPILDASFRPKPLV